MRGKVFTHKTIKIKVFQMWLQFFYICKTKIYFCFLLLLVLQKSQAGHLPMETQVQSSLSIKPIVKQLVFFSTNHNQMFAFEFMSSFLSLPPFLHLQPFFRMSVLQPPSDFWFVHLLSMRTNITDLFHAHFFVTQINLYLDISPS